jgi:ATP-dependent RNA helicase DDX47/RRP3
MPSPSEASTSRSTSPDTDADTSIQPLQTFEELGVIKPLLTALEQLSFKKPTEIQAAALPHALEGRDIIGVAETVGFSTT